MAGGARTRPARRGQRRRSLGQNFLAPELAECVIDEARFEPADLVVEIGAGSGALTLALARRGIEVLAVEIDPHMADRLRARLRSAAPNRVRVLRSDFLDVRLPERSFRVLGSLPFGRSTDILRRLLDDPALPLRRADLILQWEVARKRAAAPPDTLQSTAWAPWWEFRLGRRIPAQAFRPVPRVDAGVLQIVRRERPLLPASMSRAYARFVRSQWPFEAPRRRR